MLTPQKMHAMKCSCGGWISVNVTEIATNLQPMWSLYKTQYKYPEFTLQACILPELSYVSMSFVFELVCTVNPRIKKRPKMRQHYLVRATSKKSSWFDGTFHTEHNGSTFAVISEILKEWDCFQVYHYNIWQLYRSFHSLRKYWMSCWQACPGLCNIKRHQSRQNEL